jgi:small-conductance mechanosensitive channel
MMKMSNKPKAEGPCRARRSRLYVTLLLSAMTLVFPLIPTRAQNTAGQMAGHSDQPASINADASQRKADSGIASVEAALIAALAAALGWFAAHWLTTRREDRTKRLQLTIDHSEKQIGEFYAPLIYRLEQLDTLVRVKDKIPESQQNAVSETMYREYFLPIHQEIISILTTKIHLLEGATIPDKLLEYYQHFTSENLAWRVSKENIEIWNAVTGFPGEFPGELKEHQQVVYQRHEDALQQLRH